MTTTGSTSGAQLIARAVDILRALPRGSAEGRRLKDIALATGLAEPTARRILLALIQERLVAQDETTRHYRLGTLISELALASPSYPAEIAALCRPHLAALSDETGDSVYLAMRTGVETICLDRADGAFPIRAEVVQIGQRRLLGLGTGGVSLLATMSDREVDEIFSSVAYAEAEEAIEELRRRVSCAREKGYADISDRPVPGVRAVGVAIPCRQGASYLTVSVTAVTSRLTDRHLETILPALQRCASSISDKVATTITTRAPR